MYEIAVLTMACYRNISFSSRLAFFSSFKKSRSIASPSWFCDVSNPSSLPLTRAISILIFCNSASTSPSLVHRFP